ncbi:hypothetical protein KI387_032777 [Taxus chinensis]|uniref:non-specific serine/threonine protein kinase n=1 Tax=Taxus chinensis TaxID=29808 RepID=A0AA38BQ28_TAXCH|nr:hypothetical protein KI387_032777 [Taxus chinensis]
MEDQDLPTLVPEGRCEMHVVVLGCSPPWQETHVIAIKSLNLLEEEGQKSFKTECKVLGRIRQRNLIRVISACSYLNFKALILLFASNGSLEKYLYPDSVKEEDVCRLGLSECLNIVIDVAHGMEYLHYDYPVQVVHCDLKPSNVLLDASMATLVTDFGLSRLASSTNSMDSLSTTFSLRGYIGYIALEYGLGGRVSIKGDVYSYGIFLLEMVTRKRPTDAMFVVALNMQNWVRSAYPDRLMDIVDNKLLRNVNLLEQNRCLVSFIHVGLLCKNESPQERPTMRDVGRMLESLKNILMGSVESTSTLTTTISNLVRNTNTGAVEGMSDSQSSTF